MRAGDLLSPEFVEAIKINLEQMMKKPVRIASNHDPIHYRIIVYSKCGEKIVTIAFEDWDYEKTLTAHSVAKMLYEKFAVPEQPKKVEPVKESPVKKTFSTYTCKFCGSPLEFKNGKFICSHCGRVYYED